MELEGEGGQDGVLPVEILLVRTWCIGWQLSVAERQSHAEINDRFGHHEGLQHTFATKAYV